MGGGTPELAHAGGGHPLGEGDQPELTLQTRTDIIFTNEMFFRYGLDPQDLQA